MQESAKKREGSGEWMEGVERTERGRAPCVCAYVRARALVRVTVSEREQERGEREMFDTPILSI